MPLNTCRHLNVNICAVKQDGSWKVFDPGKTVLAPTAPRCVLEPWCSQSCPQLGALAHVEFPSISTHCSVPANLKALILLSFLTGLI